jgi:hypothetical protein
MADNLTLNAGSGGATAATDEISGVHYSRVKAVLGRDGVAKDVGTIARLISAASTNATSLVAAPGTVYSIFAVNLNAAVRYLKFYNKATSPTVGTDTPVLTLPIPASATGAGFTWNPQGGLDFSTGIAYAVTTGATDADTGAVAANEIFLGISYATA